MIKLSDYLDYLYSEIIQARKKADEKSVQVAKEYANHEYLKFFKAPRFTFPSIKMDIPLKVSNISAQSKYDFKLDNEKFLNELNERIVTVNREKQLNISPVTKEEIQSTEFVYISVKVPHISIEKYTTYKLERNNFVHKE